MTCNTLPRRIARDWGVTVGTVSVLAMFEVLPHWTTIAAICSLPLFIAHAYRRLSDAVEG